MASPNHQPVALRMPIRSYAAGLHPAIIKKSCKDCYASSKERNYRWWSKLCTVPHLVVWAKFKQTHYWPAKAVAFRDMKAIVFYFGKRTFGQVDRADCMMFSRINPNRHITEFVEWMVALQEADLYNQALIECHGRFSNAEPARPHDTRRISYRLRDLIPARQGRRFLATATSPGPLASSSSRALAPNQTNRDAQHGNTAGTGGLTLPETDAAGPARSMETDEEVDVVTVDQPDPPASELSPSSSQMHVERAAQSRRDKKIVWCTACDKPAVMICCWTFFYCSEECFLRDPHRQACRKSFMGNHVAVARRSTPSILAPIYSNIEPGARRTSYQAASAAVQARPAPHDTTPNNPVVQSSTLSTPNASSVLPGDGAASGSRSSASLIPIIRPPVTESVAAHPPSGEGSASDSHISWPIHADHEDFYKSISQIDQLRMLSLAAAHFPVGPTQPYGQ